MNNENLNIDFFEEFIKIKNKYLEMEKGNLKFNSLNPNQLKKTFDLKIRNESTSKKNMIKLIEEITINTHSSSSKTFFNQLFGGREEIAVIADMLVPLMNTSMYTFKIAGPQILIEKEIINKMLEKFGFKNGDGVFTPGGSISNMQAMIIARNLKNSNIVNVGYLNYNQKMIGYTSCDSHYSIIKNAGLLGIGKNNIRLIKTDSKGKMDVLDLEKNIKEDIKNSNLPFFINITCGTTVSGSFDSIEKICEICEKYKIYKHIDASLGGSVIFSGKYKYLMSGCELVDSISYNAHKMMGIPLNSSIFLTKEKVLEKNFNEKADYLYQDNNSEFNLGKKSIQCGRRNDAFKFWATYKYLGEIGFEKRINKQFELTKYAKTKVIGNSNLELALIPESICICFKVLNKVSSKICDKLNQLGLIKVGFGNFKGQEYIRLVLVNPNLKKEDIDYFFNKVIEISKEV